MLVWDVSGQEKSTFFQVARNLTKKVGWPIESIKERSMLHCGLTGDFKARENEHRGVTEFYILKHLSTDRNIEKNERTGLPYESKFLELVGSEWSNFLFKMEKDETAINFVSSYIETMRRWNNNGFHFFSVNKLWQPSRPFSVNFSNKTLKPTTRSFGNCIESILVSLRIFFKVKVHTILQLMWTSTRCFILHERSINCYVRHFYIFVVQLPWYMSQWSKHDYCWTTWKEN